MTTELIRRWTMQGAERDAEGRFRSENELRAALALRRARRVEAEPIAQANEGDASELIDTKDDGHPS